MIKLVSTPKGYSKDQDKVNAPEQTLQRIRERLQNLSLNILSHTKRIDIGRLGIPVFLSVCGEDAKKIMPTRKQMGKGASVAQAETSALMELMERYGFFTFWADLPNCTKCTWTEAVQKFGDGLIPLAEIIKACHDKLPHAEAERVLDLRQWLFCPATRISDGQTVYLPLDLFKQLGEFNGSSAGNSDVESILQGSCELVERHVCAIIDEEHPSLPTIDHESIDDPVLCDLIKKFKENGVELVLKDASLGLPVPTVIALARDPKTFPASSELVLTAGTSTSPAKAAIRAITEVAQLAGDFCTNACYEASGLPKYSKWEEAAWLLQGKKIALAELPDLSQHDMLDELQNLAKSLNTQGFSLYSIATTNKNTQVPSHYSIVPGFCFRERDKNSSLGLFVGKIICEQAEKEETLQALKVLEEIYPQGHFVPFFYGMLAMREENLELARACFAKAEKLQPNTDAKALALFYFGYTHTLEGQWEKAEKSLAQAVQLCPEMKEYRNLLGVCFFKQQKYVQACKEFQNILTYLDKGSLMDMLNLGLCHYHLGEKAEAMHYLNAVLEIDASIETAKTYLEKAWQL